ncbi:hypothetical protein [Klebsiella pneumoniae]|uniref:hypothetical protein n=1 Tax=Klebsiella pneumoniae TaxID=573 RepID=UPI000E2E0FA5|nr:hypothetical protein [Klebsiella pneumoniae]MCE0356416.1 hypothetical protein [Klebsiella pneumoniae]SYG28136.1 Uncharacterised protein [Klebsiella pneumoniae]SYG58150.1 Uncharacterised protein [Klebsiella pneumoniae]HBQ3988303.1 hypothetical protein [Klebsiella pneumoniae]HBT9098981.1 hypothetical protein [Klebsiella pneumoniae]
MTDITELAQRLKLEVHRAVSDFNPQMNIKTRDLKALVEALEKAQAKADVYDMLRDDYGLREKGVGLADFVDWQANRIAELESRTVKLPPTFWYEHDDLSRDVPVLDKRLVKKMLREAGIKVEAE